MLDNKRRDGKSFEEWMEEALQKIPMYSGEWTNFNPSDPGITVLENLVAFQVLQQSQIGETTPKVMQRLLKIAGITQYAGRCARVLLKPEHIEAPLEFPADQQFVVGETIFETEKPCHVGSQKITAVYGKEKEKVIDGSMLLKDDVPIGVHIFGKQPEKGNAIYFIMDGLPVGEELHFYMKVAKTPYRNEFVESVNNRFATISWQYYTRQGFADLQCRDKTEAFLNDGELVFRGMKDPAVYEEFPVKGFCIRGVLKQVAYDIAPSLLEVHGFLIEAFQKETSCVVKNCRKNKEIEVSCNLLADGYFRVYCREGEGKSYRRYDSYDGLKETGRYYELSAGEENRIVLTFDKQRFGCGPERVKDAIRVVIYNEEMMQRYDLGMVYGYDDQEILLPKQNIVPESFCILAERRDSENEPYYDFVKPGKKEEGDLQYELLEAEGLIRILDAGDFIEARLYLCSLSTFQGEDGNVRVKNKFLTVGTAKKMLFSNPAPGTGGRLKETVEMAARRFYEETKQPETAVCAKDYENMVRKISGLCIQKVHAVMDYHKNEVIVAVKPWSEEAFPKLTPLYKKMLEKYFASRRLLSTRVRFVGPQYAGIDVRGVIYIKRHYERYMEEIEAVLKKHLDYRNGPQNFGEVLKFEKLFYELENLDCVDSMQNLAIYPQNMKLAVVEGMDIHPAQDCLCYPGNFYLDVHTAGAALY